MVVAPLLLVVAYADRPVATLVKIKSSYQQLKMKYTSLALLLVVTTTIVAPSDATRATDSENRQS